MKEMLLGFDAREMRLDVDDVYVFLHREDLAKPSSADPVMWRSLFSSFREQSGLKPLDSRAFRGLHGLWDDLGRMEEVTSQPGFAPIIGLIYIGSVPFRLQGLVERARAGAR